MHDLFPIGSISMQLCYANAVCYLIFLLLWKCKFCNWFSLQLEMKLRHYSYIKKKPIKLHSIGLRIINKRVMSHCKQHAKWMQIYGCECITNDSNWNWLPYKQTKKDGARNKTWSMRVFFFSVVCMCVFEFFDRRSVEALQ